MVGRGEFVDVGGNRSLMWAWTAMVELRNDLAAAAAGEESRAWLRRGEPGTGGWRLGSLINE
jgi:hypothetical protein